MKQLDPTLAVATRQRRTGRRHPPLLWLAIAAVSLMPRVVEACTASSDSDRVVLGSLAFVIECVAAMTLVGAVASRRFGLTVFRLGPWYVLWTSVSFGLVTIAWRHPPADAFSGITLAGVSRALTVASLAVPLWACGYLLGPGRGMVNAATRFIASAVPGGGVGLRNKSVPWVLCGVSIVARVVEIALGHYAYLGDASQVVAGSTPYAQPLSLLGECGLSALLIAAVDLVRHEDGRRWLVFIALLSVEVSFAVVSGMKGIFVTTIGGVCITFAIGRGRMPTGSIVAGIAVLIFVIMPYNASYRSLARGQGWALTPRDAVAMAPTVLNDTLSGENTAGAEGGAEESRLGYLTSRTRAIDSLAIVVQMTPDAVPYRHVDEILLAPVLSIIPRAVWPDKPIATTGYDFGQQYMSQNSAIYSASAISPLADLYRYGGLIAVLVGMGLLGAGHRLIDEAWSPIKDLRYVVIFVPLFFSMVMSEEGVRDMLASLPVRLIVLFLVMRFAYGGSRSRRLRGSTDLDLRECGDADFPAPATV